MLHASDSFPSHWVLVLEATLVMLGLALAAAGLPPLAAAGRALMRGLRAMGRRPALAIGAIAVAVVVALGAQTALDGAPPPRVVDEWSYLLAADTFAHNRLANPPHPLGRHFEADHVLQRPTYASKYPPGQGVALAVGQVAFGHPVTGLWITAALLVVAAGWMLRAWVPSRWAVLGALLAALRLGAGSYWNQSYWGGSVAAIGGLLVLGAARRLFRQVRPLDACLLALGLAILATSRPYEGLLVALPVAALLLGGLVTGRLRPRPWVALVLPAAALLAASLAWIAVLNRAVTGDPLEFPHALYDRTHGVDPVFLWQPEEGAPDHGWRAPRTSGWHRVTVTLYLFLGLPVALALALMPVALRDRWMRFAAATYLAVAIGHFLIYPWWPHYSAPALGALLVLGVEALRHLYLARRPTLRGNRLFGPALFAAAVAIQVVTYLVQIPAQRADPTDPSRQRARLAWEFEQREGRHLLLVAYPPGRGRDWTYNPADIDGAKVVWANDLGDAANAELLAYYPDRTAWRIDAAFTATDPVPELVRPAASDGGRRQAPPLHAQ
jgi:hypothetical protein